MNNKLNNAQEIMAAAFNTFDEQEPLVQQQLRTVIAEMREQVALFDKAEQQRQRSKQSAKNQIAKDRKKVRDALIPEWCRNNLKVDMIVKVKSASRHKYRRIEIVSTETFVGRHCSPSHRVDKETGQRYHVWIDGGYITDHLFNYVQGVWMGQTKTHAGNFEPIMELIAGDT